MREFVRRLPATIAKFHSHKKIQPDPRQDSFLPDETKSIHHQAMLVADAMHYYQFREESGAGVVGGIFILDIEQGELWKIYLRFRDHSILLMHKKSCSNEYSRVPSFRR